MFDDPAFDRVRDRCNELADILRAHGPFEPHRLSLDEMEYTTLPDVEKQLEESLGTDPQITPAFFRDHSTIVVF